MPASPDTALGDLQRQFVREVLYRDAAGLPSLVRAGGPGVERRMGIYRTNARENFALALEAAFPLLLRCLGHDEFRRLAWAYQRACPSPAGNLFHVGQRLPGFLAGHLAGTDDAYLTDVTRLEWLVQEALVAADREGALDLGALAAIPPERHAGIRFHLHPSARLLRTDYGIYRLWAAGQAGEALPVALQSAERLLVLRHADGVQLHLLGKADMAWLESVQAGATLAAAAGCLPADDPGALGALLVRWVAAGALTSFN